MLKRTRKYIKIMLKYVFYLVLLLFFIVAIWSFNISHLKNQFSNGYTRPVKVSNFDKEKYRDYQSILDSISEHYDSAGIQATIIFKNGDKWNGASGFANHSEKIYVSNQSLFNIGSVTKLYTATLIMSMIEDKKLTLADSVSRWIDINNTEWKNLKIQHLLNHTSGIPDYMESLIFKIFCFPNKNWNRDKLIEEVSRQSMLDLQVFNYSNTNYLLLANIIENLNQTSFRDVLLSKLILPLKLKNTYFKDQNQANLPITHSYETQIPGLDRVNVTGFRNSFLTSGDAAGAVLSNSEDLAIFTHSLFKKRIISESNLRTMTDFIPIEEHRMPLNTGYGLGVSRWEIDGEELWGHSGFIPGFSSITMYSPNYQYAITVLTNQSNVTARKILGKLQQKLLKE